MTETIHQALIAKDLRPDEHLVDRGYVSVDHLLKGQTEHDIDLIGSAGGAKLASPARSGLRYQLLRD
ncbi:MAG: hypothetical protein HS114_00735 [Anaerolineales bacterium]|nr:hypothetical protein [Anaerolineales bacterium]